MSKEYIKCECCGKKIFFGETVYLHQGFTGTYCSAKCYADTWGSTAELDEGLAKIKGCEVYTDEKRKKELIKEIDKLTQQLDKARVELDNL